VETTFPALGNLIFTLNCFPNGVGVGGIQHKIVDANENSFAALWNRFGCICLERPYEVLIYFVLPPVDDRVVINPKIPVLTLGRVEYDLRLGTRGEYVPQRDGGDQCCERDECAALCGRLRPLCCAAVPRLLSKSVQVVQSRVRIAGFSSAVPAMGASTCLTQELNLCELNLLPNAWSVRVFVSIRNYAADMIALESVILQNSQGQINVLYNQESLSGLQIVIGQGVPLLLGKVDPSTALVALLRASDNFQFQVDGSSQLKLTLFPLDQEPSLLPAPLELDIVWCFTAIAKVCAGCKQTTPGVE